MRMVDLSRLTARRYNERVLNADSIHAEVFTPASVTTRWVELLTYWGRCKQFGKRKEVGHCCWRKLWFFVWELNPFFKMHNDPNMTGLEQQVDNDSNARESWYGLRNVSCTAWIVTRPWPVACAVFCVEAMCYRCMLSLWLHIVLGCRRQSRFRILVKPTVLSPSRISNRYASLELNLTLIRRHKIVIVWYDGLY